MDGQVVPTWKEVVERDYEPRDSDRDGPRTRIDMTDAGAIPYALRTVRGAK